MKSGRRYYKIFLCKDDGEMEAHHCLEVCADNARAAKDRANKHVLSSGRARGYNLARTVAA